MTLRGTDPESYIIEYTLVYEDKPLQLEAVPLESGPCLTLLYSGDS